MTHPAIADWREIVEIRERRWLEANAQNDPSADLLLSSLEVARTRLEAAIKYSDKPLPSTAGSTRPTAW